MDFPECLCFVCSFQSVYAWVTVRECFRVGGLRLLMSDWEWCMVELLCFRLSTSVLGFSWPCVIGNVSEVYWMSYIVFQSVYG